MKPFCFTVALVVAALPTRAAAQRPEVLWYTRGEQSVASFLAHADQISIVSPQVFTLDRNGVINVVEGHDRADRPKDLRLVDGRPVGDIHQNCRRIKRAVAGHGTGAPSVRDAAALQSARTLGARLPSQG